MSTDGNAHGGATAWEATTRATLKRMVEELEQRLTAWPVPDRTFTVETYGAVGDGVTINTIAIQAAVDACAATGGGVVRFGGGDYVTGTIDLKSGVMVEVASGCSILGSTDLNDYPDRIPQRRTVMDTHMDIRHSLIYAENVERVGLRGPGTIDFRGTRENFPGDGTGGSHATLPGRPYGMRFVDSQRIVVEDITLTNSPSWMQSYLNCQDLIFQRIRCLNQTNHNQDGIDIDGCRRVIVRNCDFNTHDDAMCFKGMSMKPTEDVLVEDSTFYTKCNSFKIGTDTQGSFRRIVARNLVMGGPPREIPSFVPERDAISGIDVATVDGGDVEDILISNVVINRAGCPIFVRVGSRGRVMPDMPEPPVGRLRRVIIENVEGTDNGRQGSFISGIRDGLVEDLIIRNVNLHMEGGVETVPTSVGENEKGYPDANQFENPLPAYGFWVRHARNVRLENMGVIPLYDDARPLVSAGGNTSELYVDGASFSDVPGG